jgi:CRP/FNR family cyclic AMP-dependent transcriptional regulator
MKEIKDLLKNNLYFKDLEDEFINFLAENSTFTDYEQESFIFSVREPAECFYLILSGKVALQMFSHEKGEIVLEERTDGEILGWSWLKPPYKWRFDAFTLKNTKLIVFDANLIKKQMEANPRFGYKIQSIFFNIVVDRFQATRLRLLKELGDNIYIPEL